MKILHKKISILEYIILIICFLFMSNAIKAQILVSYDLNGNLTSKNNIGNIEQTQVQGSYQACKNTPQTLTASGGTSYKWNTGATTNKIQFTAQASKIYTCTITTANGCEIVLEHPLTVLEETSEVSITGDQTPLAIPNAPTATYQIPTHTNASYNWQIEGGNITTGANTSTISVDWTDDYEGLLSINETNEQGCATSTGTLVVQLEKQQQIPVTTGWNLVSFYLQPPDPAVSPTMTTITPIMAQVKDEFGVYFPNQNPIFNSLKKVINGQGYWVRTTQTGSINQQGIALKPETVAIPLQAAPAWNLIGYPCQYEQEVSVALASILPQVLQVKNVDEFFDPSFSPIFNSLKVLKPGSGYWIQVNAPTTLYFPRPTTNGLWETATRSTPTLPDHWQRIAYPNSMSAIGQVTLDGEAVMEGAAIGVFVDKECRAVSPVYKDLDSSYVSLVINGTTADSLIFQLATNGQIYTAPFSMDLAVGNFPKHRLPLAFFSTTTSTKEVLPSLQFQVQPNPTSEVLNIQFQLEQSEQVDLHVLDLQGKIIQQILSKQLHKGHHQFTWMAKEYATGTYLLQLKTRKGQVTKKVMVVR